MARKFLALVLLLPLVFLGACSAVQAAGPAVLSLAAQVGTSTALAQIKTPADQQTVARAIYTTAIAVEQAGPAGTQANVQTLVAQQVALLPSQYRALATVALLSLTDGVTAAVAGLGANPSTAQYQAYLLAAAQGVAAGSLPFCGGLPSIGAGVRAPRAGAPIPVPVILWKG